MAFKEKYTISSLYIPKPSRRRSGTPAAKIRFLVAHDTGNPGSSAAANVRYYINTCMTVPANQTASAHIFVDDKEIIECIPALTGPPEKAWHVLYSKPKDNILFGANANDAAIGVEYCFGGKIDADKAYDKFVWILAKLCYTFGLNPSKDVVGHFFLDPQRKTDPVTGLAYSRRTYEQLLKDIVSEYDECIGNDEPLPQTETVATQGNRMVTSRLNIRTAPNTRASIVEVVPVGTKLQYVAYTDKGQPVNNNPVWYKTAAENWFWDGGTLAQEA